MMERLGIILSAVTLIVGVLGGFRWALNEWRLYRAQAKRAGKWIGMLVMMLCAPTLAEAACGGSAPNWTATLDANLANLASCVSQGSVLDGHKITVSSGNVTTNTTLVVNKELDIVGAGIGVSIVTLAGGSNGPAIRLYKASSKTFGITSGHGPTLSGFTFSCGHNSTNNTGVLQVGTNASTTACDDLFAVGNWVIFLNRFIQCGDFDTLGGLTGNAAITAGFGYNYGLIHHNTFDDCYGECVDIGGDGTGNNPSNPVSLQRSQAFGQFTNGTIFVEDNTINYTIKNECTIAQHNASVCNYDYGYENFTDGNSGQRSVFRYNTFNICDECRGHAVFEDHETCAPSRCDGASQGDLGAIAMEIYNNTINAPTGASRSGYPAAGWTFFNQRGGKALVYSNTWTGVNPSTLVRLTNLRSFHRPGCSSSTNARGYSDDAHEDDPGFLSEGLTLNKTTLNGTINTVTCPTMTSVSGFATDFGAVLIGTEQIDYTGISGAQLTPCTRGANGTSSASHTTGAAVNLLIFGVALEQINNTYIWNNTANSPIDVPTDDTSPNYSGYDIRSKAQRPAFWQYTNDGTQPPGYTAYPYPHPLQGIVAASSVASSVAVGRVLRFFEVLVAAIGISWHFRRGLLSTVLLSASVLHVGWHLTTNIVADSSKRLTLKTVQTATVALLWITKKDHD